MYMSECLFLFHAKTTEWILMNLYNNIAYTSKQHKTFNFIHHLNDLHLMTTTWWSKKLSSGKTV